MKDLIDVIICAGCRSYVKYKRIWASSTITLVSLRHPQDILQLGVDALSQVMTDQLLSHLVLPVLVGSVAKHIAARHASMSSVTRDRLADKEPMAKSASDPNVQKSAMHHSNNSNSSNSSQQSQTHRISASLALFHLMNVSSSVCVCVCT